MPDSDHAADTATAELTPDRKHIVVPVAVLEPLLNMLCSLEVDAERGAGMSGLGMDAPGYGRSWAAWRAKTRMNYRELKALKDCIWPAIQRSPATRFGTITTDLERKSGEPKRERRK